MEDRRRLLLGLLILIGLAARLGVANAIHDGLNAAPIPGSDAFEYANYAWNLSQGRGYRGISPGVRDKDHLTAYRPPGTSVVWAGVYRVIAPTPLSEHRHAVVRILHCVIGSLTILLVYFVGVACFGRSVPSVPLIAASLYAVWPASLVYSGELLSEPLGTFWLMAYVAVSLSVAARPTMLRSILAGLLLGMAILVRPNALLMVPLSLLWALWQFRGAPRDRRRAVLIPVVALLALMPWTVRNYAIFNAFVPLSTGGGDVLLGANNDVVASDPDLYGYWIWPGDIPQYAHALAAPDDEIVRDRLGTRFALAWLKQHPDQWLRLAWGRMRRAWTPLLQPNAPTTYRVASLVFWGPVFFLMALSLLPTLIWALRRGEPAWLLHLVVLHVVVGAVVFWGSSRFRYPIEGVCIVLATVPVGWILKRAIYPAPRSSSPRSGDSIAARVQH